MASKYGYMATIGADTSGLTAALKNIENDTKNISRELKQVNEGLKFDPSSIENMASKSELLSKAIEKTKEKLEALKSAEAAINEAAAKGTITTEQQQKYQRELSNTESQLRQYQQQLSNTEAQLKKAEAATDDVGEETKQLGKTIDDAGKKSIKFGDILKANVLSDFVVSGIRKLTSEFVDFAKESIEVASNLTEVQNVVDVTFGDDAGKIYTWAENAKNAYGMSQLAAEKYAGTMGAMLKSSGIAADEVEKLSTDLVGLAGDMASFYNLDIETAFTKIRSGISGETEPLKQLGINMSVANMEAFALAQGIEKSWRSMSQAEQTQLRYLYLMEQTADAQGDFVRTSDSFANQQRIMQLNMEEMKATVGEKLIPVVSELTQLITSSMPSITNDIEGVGNAVVTVSKFLLEHKETVISLASAYATFKGAMAVGNTVSGAIGAYKSLTTATKAATVAQEANNLAVSANPYVLLISAVVAAGVAIGSYVMQLDSAIESEKEIKKAAEDTMASAEAEARTVEAKAERYRRLYDEYKNTGVATSEMIELAKELQELSPGTIQLIDEEKNAYYELSDSIKDVISQIRLKGIEEAKSNSLESYYNNITEYYKQQAAAYQDYSKSVANISNETLAELEKGSEGAYKEFFDNVTGEYGEYGMNRDAAMMAAGLDPEAFQIYNDALYQRDILIDSTNKKIEENERLIEETSKSYDMLAESISGANETEANTVVSGSKIAEEERKKGLARAEAQKQANEEYAKQQEEFENQLKEDWESLAAEYNKHLIVDSNGEQDEEAYYKKRRQYLEEHCDKSSEVWWKYWDEVTAYEKKKRDEQVKAAQKLAEDKAKADKEASDKAKKDAEDKAKAEFDAWKDAASDAYDETTKEYQAIVSEKEKAFNELSSIDLTSTVKDKDGNEKTILTDLNKARQELTEYETALEKLKATGISDDLMNEILGMNYENGDRMDFIQTLLDLDPKKLELYYSDYAKYNAKAMELSQEQIQDKLTDLNAKTENAVDGIFKSMPESAYEEGAKTAQSFLQGIYDSMGDTVDLNAARAVLNLNGSNGGGSAAASSGKSETVAALNTPITIVLNDKEYINTTLGEVMSNSALTGSNQYSL